MRGFVNSWAIGMIALSMIILFSEMLVIGEDVHNVDAAYSAELVRWAGDFDNVSSAAGQCQKGVLGSQLVGSSKINIEDDYSTGHARKLSYSSSLVDFNLTFVKNYPPRVRFVSPNGGDIDCENYTDFVVSWYRCDPDGDAVTTTLYVDGYSLGSTTGTTLTVDCDKLSSGQHTFMIVGTDGEKSYTDTVTATVEK